MSAQRSTRIPPAVLESAASWYMALQEGADEALLQAHLQWLESRPEHRQAWARVEKLQQTLAAAPDSITRSAFIDSRMSRRQAIKSLSLILALGAGGTALWQQKHRIRGQMANYRTAIGQGQQLTLADASELHLNTATAVDVEFGEISRAVHLYHGEITVETGSDTRKRPFVVHTPQGSIRALGTRFVVRSDGRSSRISVLEHVVEVAPGHRVSDSLRLVAGQELEFNAHKTHRLQAVDPNVDAWVKGLLVVSDWPLPRFIAELSRYYPGRLSSDEGVAGLRISGVFQLHNIQAVLENLSAILPLKLHYFSRYWLRISRS